MGFFCLSMLFHCHLLRNIGHQMEYFDGLQNLVLTPQLESGYTVTSPLLPELVTEGSSLDEALENVKDALVAVIELYQDLGCSLPENTQIPDTNSSVWLETVVSSA